MKQSWKHWLVLHGLMHSAKSMHDWFEVHALYAAAQAPPVCSTESKHESQVSTTWPPMMGAMKLL